MTPLRAAADATGDVGGAALGDLAIEQSMNVEITSVSKKEEPLLQATSAIYVITGEDIRRSGVDGGALELSLATEIQRSICGKVTLRFLGCLTLPSGETAPSRQRHQGGVECSTIVAARW